MTKVGQAKRTKLYNKLDRAYIQGWEWQGQVRSNARGRMFARRIVPLEHGYHLDMRTGEVYAANESGTS